MLNIKSLFKESKNTVLNNMNLNLLPGDMVTIECSNDLSDMLFNLIIAEDLPGRGEILIGDMKNIDFMRRCQKDIGIVFREEGYFRMTVEEYLSFFSKILHSKVNYREVMMKLGLLDIGSTRITKLSFQQKKRLSFARERLKDLKILIFQEPLANADNESTQIIMENIQELRGYGVSVLCTSASYKDILLLGGKLYYLDKNGLIEIDKDFEEKDSHDIIDNSNNFSPLYKIEKIPAKVEDKILLFDPIEIDYIESEHGISSLSIRGDKFPCAQSLTDLEARLTNFGFFRCHRSYLVNLQRVREVITWTRNSYSLSLDDKKKTSIPLSKGRLDNLKDILKI